MEMTTKDFDKVLSMVTWLESLGFDVDFGFYTNPKVYFIYYSRLA